MLSITIVVCLTVGWIALLACICLCQSVEKSKTGIDPRNQTILCADAEKDKERFEAWQFTIQGMFPQYPIQGMFPETIEKSKED